MIEAKPKSKGDLIRDAFKAIETLKQSRREACHEYDERMRKLRDLMFLMITEEGPEMFDVQSTVSPEIQRLLDSPTHSL